MLHAFLCAFGGFTFSNLYFLILNGGYLKRENIIGTSVGAVLAFIIIMLLKVLGF